MNTQNDRKLAAKLGRQIMDGQISFRQFSEEFPEETGDYEIFDLFDLIEHIPKQGGFFGVSQTTYDLYIIDIKRMIEQLEK